MIEVDYIFGSLAIIFLIVFAFSALAEKDVILIIYVFLVIIFMSVYSFVVFDKMKYSYCENCDKQYEIEYRYCPMDGTLLVIK